MRNLFVIIWVLLLFPLQKSWGQSGGYNDYYEGYSIQTKAAKWHDLQNEFQISAADRFEGVKFWEIAGGNVQERIPVSIPCMSIPGRKFP